jgi:large subunit ribosomal protein L25
MKPVSLISSSRTLSRRGGSKKLRAQGRIPAVIYGDKVETQSLEIPQKELERMIHHAVSETILVDLEIKDDPRAKRLALLKQVQQHPLSGKVLHVDLYEVAEDKPVIATVPVELKGESKGVKTSGGTLEHVLFNVKVQALPRNLPEVIELDVTELDLNQTYHISDIVIDEKVTMMSAADIPVVSVKPSRLSKTTDEDEAETGAAVATEEKPAAEKKAE